MTSPAILPTDEPRRMSAVRRYDILDTPPDGAFDRITAIAARRFGVPISIISIVDHDRIWFKSHHGLDVQQIGRDAGLCASAILSEEPWLLPDAKADVRSLTNPLVAGEFGLRFYAGIPLQTHDGYNLGTLCVIDKEPRPIDAQQIADLKDLALVVMDQLELRLSARRGAEHAEIMTREIDHRVMNSLQFVSTVLRMQARESGNPEVAHHLQTAASRVLAVSRVHQHFHLEGPSERVGCLTYLRRLCADLAGILETSIEVHGDDALILTLQIQPIGLAINELVTNAAKYGNGRVEVRFQRASANTYVLSVLNGGEALPPDFDPIAKSKGLGMTVVRALARQLQGELEAGPNPAGGGACFTLTFPAI
jgi:two-component sensor histidine kinase